MIKWGKREKGGIARKMGGGLLIQNFVCPSLPTPLALNFAPSKKGYGVEGSKEAAPRGQAGREREEKER